ncbi:MAG: DUF2218 domain-containing protein [Sphingomonadaceae bacterium]
MEYTAAGSVPTSNASKYLQQLCKHWAHNLDVSFDAQKGKIVFPKDARGSNWPGDATVTFTASDDALAITIDATAQGQVDGLKGAVERHLDRFAFREVPLAYNWN